MIIFDRPPGRDVARESNLRGFKFLVHAEWKEVIVGKIVANGRSPLLASGKLGEETITLYARDPGEIQTIIEGRYRGKIVTTRTFQQLETACEGCGAVVIIKEAASTQRDGKVHYFCPSHVISSFPDEIRVDDLGKVISL